MALLSDSERRRIVIALGYSYEAADTFTSLKADFPEDIRLKVLDILGRVEGTPDTLEEMARTAYAKKVDDIEVDYAQSLLAVKGLHHANTLRLSDLLGLPLNLPRGSQGGPRMQYQ